MQKSVESVFPLRSSHSKFLAQTAVLSYHQTKQWLGEKYSLLMREKNRSWIDATTFPPHPPTSCTFQLQRFNLKPKMKQP